MGITHDLNLIEITTIRIKHIRTGGNNMFRYKIVKIKTGILSMKPKENYYDIIENHSRDGWRLVQILDRSFQQRYIELIFEKQID